MPPIYNHVVNHIAISVPDCDAAAEWYNCVFGFKKIRSDKLTDRDTHAQAPIFRIYGNALRRVKIAFLSTGNNVGFEVFEFVDPPHEPTTPSADFEFTKPGVFHICVTAPDVEGTVERVLARGGSQVGQIVDVGRELDGSTITAAYVKDPWGTVVEVLSCSFEQLMANRA